LGRRRRRVVRIVKKKLPTVFVCPRCGEEAVRVTIAKDTGHATVLCALCNLKDDFPAHPAAQPIDVYSYFTDRFYGVKDPRPIIPHDREMIHAPPTEDAAEEQTVQSSNELAPEAAAIEVEKPEVGPMIASEENSQNQAPESTTQFEPSIQEAKSNVDETATDQKGASESSEKETVEESEPFADIMENKDKKRYSSTPLPQQSSEQTS
jgi:transcription elongation factor Elf1